MKITAAEHDKLEQTETPEYESKEHSTHFLKKAEKLSERHKVERKGHEPKHGAKKPERKSPRKKG